MTRFFIGLDLGQQQDYTALAVAERLVPPLPPVQDAYPWQPDHPLHALWDPHSKPLPLVKPLYHLRHLQRFPLARPTRTSSSRRKPCWSGLSCARTVSWP